MPTTVNFKGRIMQIICQRIPDQQRSL